MARSTSVSGQCVGTVGTARVPSHGSAGSTGLEAGVVVDVIAGVVGVFGADLLAVRVVAVTGVTVAADTGLLVTGAVRLGANVADSRAIGGVAEENKAFVNGGAAVSGEVVGVVGANCLALDFRGDFRCGSAASIDKTGLSFAAGRRTAVLASGATAGMLGNESALAVSGAVPTAAATGLQTVCFLGCRLCKSDTISRRARNCGSRLCIFAASTAICAT